MRRSNISIPTRWRCKNPIIFRATEQWFVSIEDFREQALDAIEQVQWIPKWGIDRISNMVRERSDWCISRQRLWGVPIPIFYCKQCGEPVVNEETIKRVADLFRREGSDGWFIHTAEEILPPDTSCPACGHREFVKEKDIMDVWFDSGSSHMAVLEQREGLRWPADLYLEGSDQHRGWFQSSLLTSVAVRGTAPYKGGSDPRLHCGCRGPEDVQIPREHHSSRRDHQPLRRRCFEALGCLPPITEDIRVSPKILEQMSDVYRRIRNTIRFMLGNLADFRPAENKVAGKICRRWTGIFSLSSTAWWKVIKAYDDYEFHVVYHGCTTSVPWT